MQTYKKEATGLINKLEEDVVIYSHLWVLMPYLLFGSTTTFFFVSIFDLFCRRVVSYHYVSYK